MNEPGTKEYAQETFDYFREEHPEWEVAIKCDEGWWYVDFPPNAEMSNAGLDGAKQDGR